jgi:hypothetical protein
VKGVRRIGVRLGNWLTPEQGRRLLGCSTPSTARQMRDHTMVAMLIGCGLRRAELLALRLESIQQREEHWVIADLVGKGGHVRTVPIATWVKSTADAWTAAAAITLVPGYPRDQQDRACLGRWHVAEGAMGCRPLRGRLAPGSTSWPRTTCAAPARVSATSRAANWIRSSFCLATSPSKRRSATSDANRSYESR